MVECTACGLLLPDEVVAQGPASDGGTVPLDRCPQCGEPVKPEKLGVLDS